MTAAPALEAAVPEDPLELLPRGAVVAVAMSGGVDSSVAAALLVERGVRCFGVTLAMWPRQDDAGRDRACCGADAATDARRVAALLAIRHYAWNLEEVFTRTVVHAYGDDYAAGRTPNPCVRCNDTVKFGALLERARATGATHLATGHHARLGRRGARPTLHRAHDRRKDQSYTLYRLDADRLSRATLPLGRLRDKQAVRAEAARLGLPVAGRPESQDLCFVTGSVRDDLRRRLDGRLRPGRVVDENGDTVGEHEGAALLTVGQRSGMRIAPRRPDQAPLHVLHVDVTSNVVVVGPRARLLRRDVEAQDCHWLGDAPTDGDEVDVQAGAHAQPRRGIVQVASRRLHVVLDEPAPAIAPGQAVVLYRGDEVLGGGVAA